MDTFPLVCVFGLPIDHLEALQDVDDVVDPSSLHSKLSCALVQVEEGLTLTAIEAKEPSAQLSKAFFLPTVLELGGRLLDCHFTVFGCHRGIFVIS